MQKSIDIGYWESLLYPLQAHMTRARLRDQQGIFHAPTSVSSKSSSTSKKKDNENNNNNNNQSNSLNDNEFESNEDLENKCLREYEKGCYLPRLVDINDLDLKNQKCCIDETVDWEKLKQQRESVIKSCSVKPDVEDAFEAFVRSMGSLTADDSLINTVLPMDVQYLWLDKYRPRKPHVFNKVHTGYDWNQYNKKHYDTDNPPPKIVQGYKFN
ncbi:unnamed protein product, partial [Rotaria sp. Silwood2]